MSTELEEESSSDEIGPFILSGSRSQPVSAPNAVLNRAEFIYKIYGTGIELHHLSSFYRELHLQAYPELGDFVNRYQSNKRGKQAEEDTLPESLLSFLLDANNQCVTMTSKIQETTASPSGKSVKLHVELYDGNSVDTIINRVSDRGKHVASISISSQVGCSLERPHGFANDFIRDLLATEMIEQVIHASRELQKDKTPPTIRKVVFTGNGEPLLNYDAVVASCRFLVETFKLGRGSITISTVGITPRIFDLTRDLPNVIVCLRLHAPNQELRCSILPVARQFELDGILEALDNHMATSEHQIVQENHQMLSRKRRVMIEYLMVKGVTTTVDCAHELGELCALRDLIVTLVPFVRWSKEDARRCPSVRAINEFNTTVSAYGVQCSVRLSVGSDINSLAAQLETEQNSSRKSRKPDSDNGEEKSDFWRKLDLFKNESTKKRREELKLAEEDSVKIGSSVASDLAPLTVFLSPSNRSDAPDDTILGIGSMDLDDYSNDAPEVFLNSSQEMSMVLSNVMFSEDSFDDACDTDAVLDGSPRSDSSPRPLDRAIPYPNSLLDRVSFLEALDDADIDTSMSEIDAFYIRLHQLDYPPIGDFVQSFEDSRHSSDVAKADTKQSVPLKLLNFALDPLNSFVSMSTKIHSCSKSSDLNSFRLYIQLHDGHIVETMVMRIALEGKQYANISVSTQISSPIGLSGNFNLQTSEIIEQIIHATRTLEVHKENEHDALESIGTISFLGCGEPLLNYDNVVDACFFVAERPMWNVNKELITISTIGITPRIFDLTRDLPEVNIALDLRAPTQDLRSSLVPLAQRYSLDGVMEALANHARRHNDPEKTADSEDGAFREKVKIRYKMVQDETSKLECAHELGLLCNRHKLGVNLVPYIRRSNEDKRKCPSMRHINEFKEVVTSYGVACIVKLPLGATVKDPKKQFVVAAERRSSSKESVVRMKYMDDKRREIDFWETLAVVKKESKRKRRKSRQLKIEKGRALNWYNNKVMVANCSPSVLSFVAVGVFSCAGTSVDADDVVPVIEFGHGSFPTKSLSAETSAETWSVETVSTNSDTENALAGWSAIDASAPLSQDCTESTEGPSDSTGSDCLYGDEATFAESQNNIEEGTNTCVALPSPAKDFIHDTESNYGVSGAATAAVAVGPIGALSFAVFVTEYHGGDGGGLPEVNDNEFQVSREEISSDSISLAVSDNVLDVETETRGLNGGVAAVETAAGGAVGAFLVGAISTNSADDDDDHVPESTHNGLEEGIEEVSSESSSLAAADNDSDTETEIHGLNGEVVASSVGVAGGAAGTLPVATSVTNAGGDDDSVTESRSHRLQKSAEEVSLDILSLSVTNYISDTETETRGLDDGDDKAPSVNHKTAQLDSQPAVVDTNSTNTYTVSDGAVSTCTPAVEETLNRDEGEGGRSNSHSGIDFNERTLALAPVENSADLASRADDMLASIGAVLKSEIDGGGYELSPELLDEISQSSVDDFSFSSAPGDHSATMKILVMQQNMMAQLKNSVSDDEVNDDLFSALFTIDEHETENDDSEYFDDCDTEYNNSSEQMPESNDESGLYAADFDSNALSLSERSSKGQAKKLNTVVTITTALSADGVTLEERLDESEKARAKLDASNKFLFSQMEQIALQANEELTAQIEQSEAFRRQVLDAQTMQKRAEEEKAEIENILNESGILRERNELREQLSVLQFEHNKLQAGNTSLEKKYALASSKSTPPKESESTTRAPAARLADALEEIKRVHEENIRLTSDTDERSYKKEKELTEILAERKEMQKALREAVQSLTLKEARLAIALQETRRVEQKYAQLVRDNNAYSVGKEQELLDTWKGNDDLQKALGEAIACTNQKEEELARLTAASDEKILKEAASALMKKEEEFVSLAALVEINAGNKEVEMESLLLQNQAMEQHLAAAYRFSEDAPSSESTAQLTQQVAYLKSRVSERNSNMQRVNEEHAELKAMCDHLEHEKAEMAADAERERAKASEKLTLVSDMAKAHLTGRMGLEARLQASEVTRHQLDLDHKFMAARMEVIDLQSVTEIQSLKAQAQHFRLLLTEARNEHTKAEEENVILELQQVMSDAEDDSESSSHYDSESDLDGTSSRSSSIACNYR